MFFNLSRYENDVNEIVKFLNSSAKSLYTSKTQFKDPVYGDFFKSNILTAIIDFERSIRGTFDCDINLNNADINRLTLMFPNLCQNIFSVYNDNDVKSLGMILENLRNMNAHSIVSSDDLFFFDHDYSTLINQTKFNCDINYYTHEITIAGYIFIILNFLRKESITALSKNDFLFSIVSEGFYKETNGSDFIEKISHVDLEIPIRFLKGEGVFKSIVGERINLVRMISDSFTVHIGNKNMPTFSVSGNISNNSIRINKNSLTKIYYEDDYCLSIEDSVQFITLSNMLPPFVFIDFLYKKRINVFTTKIAIEILDDLNIILKLNKPKFYIDKNIDILLLPRNVSDSRMISSIIVDALIRIFLCLESKILSTNNITISNEYSTIRTAFEAMNTSSKLINELSTLRNLVAHGYILNEYAIFGKEKMQFSFSFTLQVLKNILMEFKIKNKDIYFDLVNNIKIFLIKKLISAKYKLIIGLSKKIMDQYPNFDNDDLTIKSNFIKNSVLDINEFFKLNDRNLLTTRLIKIKIPNIKDYLFIYDTKDDYKRLDYFCQINSFRVASEYQEGLFNVLTLS